MYLLDHWFILEGYNLGTVRWKRCTGKVWGRDMELPRPLQAHYPPSTQRCSANQKLSEPYPFRIFSGGFITWLWSIVNWVSSPSLLGLRVRGEAESSKLLIMAWSFRWSASILKLYRNPLSVSPLKQKTPHHLGNSKGLRSSVSGTRANNQVLEQKKCSQYSVS